VLWSLDTCSTQHSLVHRVQMHGASNRDSHLYQPHNNVSVYLTTTTYVRRTGRITTGRRSGWTTLLDSVLSSPTSAHTPWNDPPKNSVSPAQPPPHLCRTLLLLLAQMGYGLLCGLKVCRRRTNRRPCCPPMSNPSTCPWTARPDGSGR